MIKRTILSTVLNAINYKPAVLMTGAMQVGKTTLCQEIKERLGFGYVTLADSNERRIASRDPAEFLKLHPCPVIIDEVQYAPELFVEIESVIDAERMKDPKVHGLFVLTGSQAYNLMENVTQSLAGRITILTVPPISLSEEHGTEEHPFRIDPEEAYRNAIGSTAEWDLYAKVFRGMYPEIVTDKKQSPGTFYSDYTDTYILRNVSQITNIQDKDRFRSFMEITASLTGQELVYETLTNALGTDPKTVKRWLSILIAGNIIFLLEPYSDRSVTKRVTKRPKIYFRDTGLACYLCRIPTADMLIASYLKGPMTETFIVNEIMKTHENNGLKTPFFYYRDNNRNEIDLLMLYDGKLNMIECKAGTEYGTGDIKTFQRIQTTFVKKGCIVCNCDKPYPITKEVYAIPIRTIGL